MHDIVHITKMYYSYSNSQKVSADNNLANIVHYNTTLYRLEKESEDDAIKEKDKRPSTIIGEKTSSYLLYLFTCTQPF